MHSKALADAGMLTPCTVTNVSHTGDTLRRVSDLGFTEGADVMRLFSSPSGGMSAYLIRDTVIALRRSDAEKIYITEGCDER